MTNGEKSTICGSFEKWHIPEQCARVWWMPWHRWVFCSECGILFGRERAVRHA